MGPDESRIRVGVPFVQDRRVSSESARSLRAPAESHGSRAALAPGERLINEARFPLGALHRGENRDNLPIAAVPALGQVGAADDQTYGAFKKHKRNFGVKGEPRGVTPGWTSRRSERGRPR